MARTQAKTITSIWSDPDWLALPASAQRLYWLLYSQPKLTIVGSLDVMVDRWARLATDTTPDSVRGDLAVLAAPQGESGRPWIVVDGDELIVRTFVAHDLGTGTVNRNLVKGMWSAWAALASPLLRKVVVDEMPDAVFDREGVDIPQQAADLRKQPRSEPWLQPQSEPQIEPPSEPSVVCSLLSEDCSLPTATAQVSGLLTTPEPESQTRANEQQPVVDEQTIRRTAALIGRSIADQAGATNPAAYATTVTTGILTGHDRTDRNRIVQLLAQGQDPETIAAAWQPDPLAGLFPGDQPRNSSSEPPRPALAPFDPDAHLAEAEAQRAAYEAHHEPQEVTW